MKELSLEEVLQIAGGVPLSAALDEVTYRAPKEAASDPIERARLLARGSPTCWGESPPPPSESI